MQFRLFLEAAAKNRKADLGEQLELIMAAVRGTDESVEKMRENYRGK